MKEFFGKIPDLAADWIPEKKELEKNVYSNTSSNTRNSQKIKKDL